MIRANQYDSGEIWRFTLFDEDGVKYIPSSAIILGTTMSGTLVTRDATIEDDKVIVEESRSMTQSPGLNLFELVIDGGSHGTSNFIVAVEPRPNKVFLSENDLQTMEKAIEAGASVGDIKTQVEANTNAIESERTARQTANNALQGNINSEAATRASADSNLQAQINQIIAPSGEAPSAAEVQNARIGADGVTYDTLGNAIRGQVGDLKSDLGNTAFMDNPMEHFEMGNISIGESGWWYSSSDTRVRTKERTEIHAYKGDVIGLTSYADARYYLGWKRPDGTYGYNGWRTSDFTVEEEGEYIVLICNLSDRTQSDKTALASLFKFRAVAFERITANSTSIKTLSLLNPIEYKGFIADDGTIGGYSAEYREKHTNGYNCKVGDEFKILWEANSVHNFWLAYALYDENGAFLSRITLASGAKDYYENKIVISNESARYIKFTYRTFDDANIQIYSDYNLVGYDLLSKDLEEQIAKSNLNDSLATILPTLGGYPHIDTMTKKLTIPNGTLLLLKNAVGGAFYINMASGSDAVIDYSFSDSSALKFYFNYIDKTYSVKKYNEQCPANSVLVCALRSNYWGGEPKASMSCPYIIDGKPFGILINDNSNIKSVNHRGFNTIAPENTLPAYRLSRQNGFSYVETDVSFTSDGVAVLLHDDTINRTARNADGTPISETINIADITYAQALTYDFGIWKESAYAGTRIPTLEEFVVLCRNIGLHPYIELKAGTQQRVEKIVEIVKACGMADNVSWISFSNTLLSYVKSVSPKARLGYVVGSVTSEVIETAQSLKTTENEVFIDSESYTSEECELCKNGDFPMEVWTVDNKDTILNMNPYITGVTSDSLKAGLILYTANIS